MNQNQFVKFPSIERFPRFLKESISFFRFSEKPIYKGQDEKGEEILEYQNPLPTLTFEGTVKLHGTNAAISIRDSEYFCQSRNRIITPENDNLGFAAFVKELDVFSVFPDIGDVTWFGEYIGKGIQQKVAVSQLERKFIVFAALYGDEWIDIRDFEFNHPSVKNIYSFQTSQVVIDFNKPDFVIPALDRLVEQVESECPVGRTFGVSGCGEGWVFRPTDTIYASNPRFWFKAKGEKHSNVVKIPINVDPEVSDKINKFIDKHVNEERLTQGIYFLKEFNKPIDETSTGVFIKWVLGDILKEERNELESLGLNEKDLNKNASRSIKDWFFKYIKL